MNREIYQLKTGKTHVFDIARHNDRRERAALFDIRLYIFLSPGS
jgi:hypothetical protein